MSDKLRFSQVEQRPKGNFSIIWIIPLLALSIGGWMLYQQWLNKDIVTTITFNHANGLEPGRTKIKSRDVDIGVLTAVHFNDDRTKIIAQVAIKKEMGDFLRQDTKFWVVKPRIGVSGISGISTIFSGAYIELYPGESEQSRNDFIGLDDPPITPPNTPGLHLSLVTDNRNGLSVGNPVIYRGFTVGRVESYKFDTKSGLAHYEVFISTPYNSLVTTNSHFWNAGGVSVSSSAAGIKLDIASLETLLVGGIQFDNPSDSPLGEPIIASHQFTLYDSKEDIKASRQYASFEYLLLSDSSIRGLSQGAPVEYRGVRIGTVVNPYLSSREIPAYNLFSKQGIARKIPILIRLEPERILGVSSEAETIAFNENFKKSIRLGMTASVGSANLITGSLLINLDFNGDTDNETDLQYLGAYTLIPTTIEGLDKLSKQLESTLDNINQLPLEALMSSTSNTVDSANLALKSLDKTILQLHRLLRKKSTQKIPENLNKSLEAVVSALSGVQPSSPAYREILKTLQKVQQMMDNLQPIMKQLNNNPNMLIFSGPRDKDLEPRKKNK